MPSATSPPEWHRKPLQYSGSLDHLEFTEYSPIIGREYHTAKIKDMLYAENAEQQIKDLAITISERGVVFFRAAQDDLTIEEQKRFTDLLGKLSGRPEENGLHVHPLFRDENNIPMARTGTTDKHVYVLNTEAHKKLFKSIPKNHSTEPKDLAREWHSDCLFEPCPADYSFLLMEETPKYGGDTLFCSGYELYDRISPSFRSYLETLTATCHQPAFKNAATAGGYEIMSPRGSPLNIGDDFAPSHPLVRTHPVTGWKTLCAVVGIHVSRINDVYDYEDKLIRDYMIRLITRNHDCVARMHWTKYSAAIWNNACVFHAATPDTQLVPGSVRIGLRDLGERKWNTDILTPYPGCRQKLTEWTKLHKRTPEIISNTKCDGEQPRCGTCITLQVDCLYLQDTRRQPRPSWLTVQNLEATIASLLKQVNSQQNDNLASPGLPIGAQHISDGSPSTNTLSEPRTSRTARTADGNLHNGDQTFEFSGSRHLGRAAFSLQNIPDQSQSNLDNVSPAKSHGGETEEPTSEHASGPSLSETQIAGLSQRNGKVSVHGISSFLHQYSGSHAAQDKTDFNVDVPWRLNNEAASARLISNSSIQRQRESYLFREPRVSIDFDGVDTEMAKHLLDLHWNRQHYAFLLTYRPAVMGGLATDGPYVNKLLLNAIYYSSCLYSDRKQLRSDPDDPSTAGLRFYDRFRSLLVDEIVNPSIPTATALVLCGATLVSHGKPSAGWILCGTAYRMLIDLGCHLLTDARLSADVSSDQQLLTDMEREMRKRLFWGAFITDATQSLYLGRKPVLQTADARVPLMLLDTFEELEEWTPYLDPRSPLSDASMMSLSEYNPKPAYAVSTFQAQAKLFQISAKITRTFYGIDSIGHSSHYLREAKIQIMQELDDWNAALPTHLRFRPGLDPVPPPHQLTPHTSYRTLNILVQRPFLATGHLKKHSDADEKAAGEKICLDAALAISKLIKAYKATFTLRRAPYLLSYAAYSAAVVLLHKGNTERTHLKGEITFFWTALCELQRGCNFGLHKPLSVLRQMMRELGESVPLENEDSGNLQFSRAMELWTTAEGGEMLNHGNNTGARFAGNYPATMPDHIDFGGSSLFGNRQGLMDVWDEDARNIYNDTLFGLFAPAQTLH